MISGTILAVAVLLPAALGAITTGPQFSALTNLYAGTNGPAWTKTWPSTGDVCTFYGVTCDAGGNNVKALVLPKNNIVGVLNDDLSALTALSKLVLSSNKIGFAPFLGGNTQLQHIDLSYNKLGARYMYGAHQLTGLTRLDVSHNFLSGTLPSQFKALKNLQYLAVNHNKLSGPISTVLTRMVRLTYVNTCSNTASFLPLPQWVNRHIAKKC